MRAFAHQEKMLSTKSLHDEANLGLMARYEFTKESHTVDMMGPIHSDTFFQDRLMLNGVNLRIKLNRAKNVHDIMSSHIHCTHLNL